MNFLLAAIALFSAAGASAFQRPKEQSRFVLYDLPDANSAPCDMDTGPDGKSIWYFDAQNNRLGVVYPQTGEVRSYPMPFPYGRGKFASFPFDYTPIFCSVTTGPNGFVYFIDLQRDYYARINPETHHAEILIPPVPVTGGRVPPFCRAWAASQGLWFTRPTVGDIVLMDNYSAVPGSNPQPPYPYQHQFVGSNPLDVMTAKNDDLWFTEPSAGRIGRIPRGNINTTFEDYQVPFPEPTYPTCLRAQTDNGRYLWAVAFQAGGLIRVDRQNPAAMRTYIYPDGGNETYPNENADDPHGNVWMSSFKLNRLMYLTPSTGRWTTIHLPPGIVYQKDDERVIPVHYGPQNGMWFTAPGTNQIGYYPLGRGHH